MKTPVDPEWVAHAQGALRLPKNARLRYADAGSIPGVRAGGRFSLTPAVNGLTPEPEFALIRESAHAPHRDTYNNDEVLFVAEIISTEIAGEPHPIDSGEFQHL
jgi:hypothetical protein